jgi:hypothetical protein
MVGGTVGDGLAEEGSKTLCAVLQRDDTDPVRNSA